MNRKINVIPMLPTLDKKIRVAAYARVSTGKDAMMHSLSAQISNYSSLIQSDPNWIFAGVYADEAKTGTKDSRENFKLLISDCKNGKIDMIITKSISRFARNTVTLLQTVRELKSLGVDIYFEEQNIHTMSSDGELMITILASYAQEESRSASENQKWRIKRNFEQGIPCNCRIFGYKYIEDRYVIVPEEAEIIRLIFSEYLKGNGYVKISKILKSKSIPSKFVPNWNTSVISDILSNYTYTGNLLLQKTFIQDHITKKTLINKGELPMYFIENSHEPIIDIATYEAVQKEKNHRAECFNPSGKHRKSYPFSGMLKCANCGKTYRRKTIASGIVWICNTYNTLGKSACASKQIPENTLINVTCEVLNIAELSEEYLRTKISTITVCDENRLIFNFIDGTTAERIWKDRSRSESWTDEMRNTARNKTKERNEKRCLK